MTVPAGSTLARFATFDADYPAGTDIDMFVYQAATSLVGLSAGGTSDESVTLTAAGSYVYLVVFALPPGQTGVDVQHNSWVVSSGSAGNFTVAPASQAVHRRRHGSVTGLVRPHRRHQVPGRDHLRQRDQRDRPDGRFSATLTVPAHPEPQPPPSGVLTANGPPTHVGGPFGLSTLGRRSAGVGRQRSLESVVLLRGADRGA